VSNAFPSRPSGRDAEEGSITRKPLCAQLDWRIDGVGYVALLDTAFFGAVDRRFGIRTPAKDITTHLADVRAPTSADEGLNSKAAFVASLNPVAMLR
jgi:hypothetical protein